MSKFTGILMVGLFLCASVFAGSGTENDPYTIAEALALSEGATKYWAQGYIVGGAYNNFDSPWTSDYSISCADTDSESDVNNCLQVKLESDGGRAAWGLSTNPGNFQKLIKFQGKRDTYGTYPSFEGVDNTDISEVALENQPPVLTAIGNKMVIESNTLSFVVTATDTLDGDEIALSATGLPAGAVFAGATNTGTASSTFTWANAGPLGDYSVTFTASDKDGTVQQVVGITVHDGSGPLEIAFQGFEGTASDTWGTTDIDATLVRNTKGTADTPANTRIRTGSYSWQPGEGEYTTEALELAAVDVSEWSDVVVTLHVSATTTEAIDGFGMYPTETLSVALALDGADYPSTADITVSGNTLAGGSITGALWSYTATGVAATTAGVSRTVAPASGGVTVDGIATVQIALPAGTTSVKLKAEVAQEYAGYFWNVDDISLAGVNDGGASDYPPTISISPEGLDKTVAVGNNLSFTIQASEILNDAGDEVRIWATGVPSGATFAGATNTGSASSVFSWTPTAAGSTSVRFYAGDKDGTNQLDVGITAYEMGVGGAAYGVVVGLNKYLSSYIPSGNWLSGCVPDANHVFTNILKRGEWNTLTAQKKLDSAGTKTAIRAAITSAASNAVAGDTFFYFHSSHGGQNSGKSVYLCTYDGDYQDTELAADLSKFAAGVKVVVMVDACHSGGLFKSVEAGTRAVRPAKGGWDLAGIVSQIMDEQRAAKLAAGKRDVLSRVSSSEIGWITAADYNQYSWDGGPNGGGVFTDKVIEGWTNNPPNSCDLNGDNYANFYEFWDYSWDVANSADLEYTTAMAHNTNVLLNTMAGWVGEAAPGGLIVFSNMTAQTVIVSETLTYPVGASTAGTNVPVTVTMTTVQAGASYAGGVLTFTPTTDGATTFAFKGTNANGGSATASLTVTATLPAPTLADPAATVIGNDRFTANWNAVTGAGSYLLDVATSDSFSAGSGGADLVSEGFATAVPGGWTMTGVGTYSSLPYVGTELTGSLSVKFDSTGDSAVTPSFAAGATNLQFWAYGNGGAGSTFAISGLVNSVWTLVDTVTVAENGATYNVALNPQTTQIGFYFTKVKNCALDDVIVQASDAGSSTLVVDAQSVAGTSYEVTGLDMDTTYYFRVRAVGNLNGPYSTTGTAHTSATDTAPSFDAIPGQSAIVGVLLSLDVSAYDSGYPAPVLSLVSSTAAIADYDFTDGTLSFTASEAENVEFVFMASNTLGTALATVNVAVASSPVYVPVASIADVTSDSFTVNWTPCTGATDYQVQVSTDSVFAADSGGNLMVNGDFETGDTTGWGTVEANYSVVTTDPQAGTYHVSCVATATRKMNQAVNITGDGVTEYEVSFWYKKPTAGGNARIWSSWSTGGQASGDNLQPTTYLQAAPAWTKVTYLVVPNSGANTLNFEVRTYNGASILWDSFFVGVSGSRGAARAILVDETVAALSYPVTGLTPETLYYARARMAGGEWSETVSATTLSSGPTAPSFAAIPAQSATVGVEFTLDVSAYDSGNPVPTLTLVSSTAAAGDYSFAGSTLSFTPSAGGSFAFVFMTSNEVGTALATATVAVAEAGAELLAPVIQAASGVQAIRFNANWLASAGATGYILDVATNADFSTGGGGGGALTNLSENFVGFIATNSGTDRASSLDTYLQTPGWTGTKVYEDAGKAKLGSTSGQGILTTPPVDLSANGGAATLTFDLGLYGSDSTKVQILHAPDGTTFAQVGSDLTPPGTLTPQTIAITGGTALSKIQFKGKIASKYRFYLDNIQITQEASERRYVAGYENLDVGNVTTYLVTGLTEGVTYYYRVMATTATSNSPYSGVTNVVTAGGGTPNPEPIHGSQMGAGGGSMSMQIQSRIGWTYQLQYTTNLFAPDWVLADSEEGTGDDVTLVDTNAVSPMRFYRVARP